MHLCRPELALPLQLDLDENNLVRVRVDTVVLDPDIARVRLPHRKLGHDLPVRGFLHQLPCGQHHHDVVVRMPVPTCLRAWRETPFRHDRAVGFNEEFGGGLGTGFHLLREKGSGRFPMSSTNLTLSYSTLILIW